MSDLSQFRYFMPLDVRFADLDALQHVNHAKYFTYMEAARIQYVMDVLGWNGDWSALGIIIAQATCQYKLPLVYGDKVKCYLRTSRLGGKSFDFEYLIERQDGVIVAEGLTINVAYDYPTQSAIPIPDAWRQAMLAYEPALSA
jgi:acyl-CoA thioester hydrolase